VPNQLSQAAFEDFFVRPHHSWHTTAA